MEKTFLTNGGNLFRFHPLEKGFYFQRPNGDFLRQVSNDEAEFLSANCLEISIGELPHVTFFPQWIFWKSIQVVQDNSNYRWETSCNGGNYSFQTYLDIYFAKFPNGEWKFAFIERHSTGAEFSYDELAGQFQSNLGELIFSNVLDGPYYHTQGAVTWKNEEISYRSEEILEKYAHFASFSDLWGQKFDYIPSKWDNEDEGFTKSALTFSDKKEIVRLIGEFGTPRSKFRRTTGRNRR